MPDWSSPCPLSTVHYPLFNVHCSLPAHCLLPAALCPLSTVQWPMPTVYCPLFTIHYLLPTVYCLLFTAHFYWPLLTVHWSLPTVLCLLPIVHWPLSIVHAVYLLISGSVTFITRWLLVENNLDLHLVDTDLWLQLIGSGQWAVNSRPRIVGIG